MGKTIKINNINELMEAFTTSEKLYGYTPSEKYDANTFKYPVIAIINEENKTFVIKQEEEIKKEEKKEEESNNEIKDVSSSSNNEDIKKAKKKKIGMIVGFTILGIAVVIGIILAIYFGVK